jgi:hypothetical protein
MCRGVSWVPINGTVKNERGLPAFHRIVSVVGSRIVTVSCGIVTVVGLRNTEDKKSESNFEVWTINAQVKLGSSLKFNA